MDNDDFTTYERENCQYVLTTNAKSRMVAIIPSELSSEYFVREHMDRDGNQREKIGYIISCDKVVNTLPF